jgi:VanZ family protein
MTCRKGTRQFLISSVHCLVPKVRVFLKYWLPALLWMVIIFSASGDSKSGEHSSRILAPLIRWIAPFLSERSVGEIVFAIRKLAHMFEYAVLALLFWCALRKPVRNDARPWSWREAILAIALVAVYAASDEFHQAFVPNRQGKFGDVVIDTVGAALGMLMLWGVGRRVKAW